MNNIVPSKKSERTDAEIIAAFEKKEVKPDHKSRFMRLHPSLNRIMIDKKLSVGDIWKDVKDDLGSVTRTTFVKWWEQAEGQKPNA